VQLLRHPAEVGTHARYDLATLAAEVENAIAAAAALELPPLVSDRRDAGQQLLRRPRALCSQVAEMLGTHPRIRGWSALVTQNVLHDRELVRTLARWKCVGLFAGPRVARREVLRRYNKTQNLNRRQNVMDDIAFAESLGIAILYGYLFDHRNQTAAEMERQIQAIAHNPLMPMPVYLSVVAPLAGTAASGTTCSVAISRRTSSCAISTARRSATRIWRTGARCCRVHRAHDAPAVDRVARFNILQKTVRRIIHARTLNPIRWYIIASANFHCFIWSSETPSQARTYVAGDDTLDPQYFEYPTTCRRRPRSVLRAGQAD
jgi:hypothetical protein